MRTISAAQPRYASYAGAKVRTHAYLPNLPRRHCILVILYLGKGDLKKRARRRSNARVVMKNLRQLRLFQRIAGSVVDFARAFCHFPNLNNPRDGGWKTGLYQTGAGYIIWSPQGTIPRYNWGSLLFTKEQTCLPPYG